MKDFNDDFDDEIEEQEEGAELWLLSYADMMTLIACFFILMMAFANYDPVGFSRKTKEIAKHFSGKSLNKDRTEIEELVLEIQGHPNLKNITKTAKSDDGVKLILQTSQLFQAGSSQLQEKSLIALNILADLIKDRNENYRIMIEGHTDLFDSDSSDRFDNNWELSAARGATVLTRFIETGFKSKNIILIAKGDSEPVVPNVDADGNKVIENMNLNRRVEIKILRPRSSQKFEKLGLGVYFDDAELVKGLGE